MHLNMYRDREMRAGGGVGCGLFADAKEWKMWMNKLCSRVMVGGLLLHSLLAVY